MNANQIFERLITMTDSSVVTLSPGPLKLAVGKHDGLGVKLLIYAQNLLPEDATNGDLFEVLEAARWWATFAASISNADEWEADAALAAAQPAEKGETGWLTTSRLSG